MRLFRLINKLDSSRDLNKDIALIFDAGKLESKKYGEATLSGQLLFLNRYGNFPTVNVKQIEERSYGWLNEIGLEDYQDFVFNKVNIPAMVAYSTPGINPEKLGLYFKLSVLLFLIDDDLIKLNFLNANNQIQHAEDTSRLVKILILIIESRGNDNLAKEDAPKHPLFEATCRGLSHICRECSEQMNEEEYTNFAKELVDYFRVNKWLLEFQGSPYKESDYLFLRFASIGMLSTMYSIFLADDIFLPNEIIVHPLFQSYNKNIIEYAALCNDIISLPKEVGHNEDENFVLTKCRKYSLQRSIYKAEKTINELVIDLRKNEIKLNLYFPSDQSLKNYFKMVKCMADGYLYWYMNSTPRYGNIKFEIYVVEYDSDYKTWLEKISSMNEKSMEESVFTVKSKNGAVFLSPFPPPPTSKLALSPRGL